MQTATKHTDFIIDIDNKYKNGNYIVRAKTADGAEVEDELKLPFTFAEIEPDLQAMLEFDPADIKQMKDRIDQIGYQLYQALFTPKVKARLAAAKGKEKDMIRIRLKYNPKDDVHSEVGKLPWELMRAPEDVRPLCLNHRSPFCRYMEMSNGVEAPELPRKLRILVVVAEPQGHEFGGAEMKERLMKMAHGSPLDITILEKACPEALRDELRRPSDEGAPYHVIQFLGHGGYDAQRESYALLLEDDNGLAKFLTGEELVNCIPDDPNLRLVSLMACNSGNQNKPDGFNPFVGVAETLTQTRVPAVIGMQFPISVPGAFDFLEKFYQNIMKYDPIDVAITEGRIALSQSEASPFEWITPVLYMRAQDGHLFKPPKIKVVHINSVLGGINEKDVKDETTPDDFKFLNFANYFEGVQTRSGRINFPAGWELIKKELTEYRTGMSDRQDTDIRFTGKSRLSVWLTAGYVFRHVTGFRLRFEQFNNTTKENETWTDEIVSPRPVLEETIIKGNDPKGPTVVAISLVNSIKNDVIHYLNENGINYANILLMQPPVQSSSEPLLRNKDDGNAVVAQVFAAMKELKENAMPPMRKVLLFYNGPAAPACFLAARLNVFPPIQAHEFIPGEGYVPSVLLTN